VDDIKEELRLIREWTRVAVKRRRAGNIQSALLWENDRDDMVIALEKRGFGDAAQHACAVAGQP